VIGNKICVIALTYCINSKTARGEEQKIRQEDQLASHGCGPVSSPY